MKIKSPNTDYTNKDRYGDTVLEFKQGVAEVDELPAGVRLYLQSAGYGIDAEPETAEVAAPADPRKLENERVGTELRDAAVTPKPEDFLAPVNAGQEGDAGNPHGPNVVSPELHASQGIRPVTAGPVNEPAKQEAVETAHAEASRDNGDLTGVAKPAGNASRDEWAEYATAQGKDVDGLSRDDIRALFN